MTQYLLSIYQPDGAPPEPEVMAEIGRKLGQLNDDIKAAGSWVFTGGLHSASSATVLRPGGNDVVISDGPYVEGKEHLGGLWIIDAPDLDAALEWGRRATEATTLPIEVRPFQDVAEY
ncbi:YciI family protein [soil metagenome]